MSQCVVTNTFLIRKFSNEMVATLLLSLPHRVSRRAALHRTASDHTTAAAAAAAAASSGKAMFFRRQRRPMCSMEHARLICAFRVGRMPKAQQGLESLIAVFHACCTWYNVWLLLGSQVNVMGMAVSRCS